LGRNDDARGIEVAGFPPRGSHSTHLETSNPRVMWADTNLSDPRWKFTRKYLTLRQDPTSQDAQKLGLFSPDTWAAYFLNDEVFVKRTKPDPSKTYPDFESSLFFSTPKLQTSRITSGDNTLTGAVREPCE
jgi:hypothetical protein